MRVQETDNNKTDCSILNAFFLHIIKNSYKVHNLKFNIEKQRSIFGNKKVSSENRRPLCFSPVLHVFLPVDLVAYSTEFDVAET